jgi:hypothetical protein
MQPVVPAGPGGPAGPSSPSHPTSATKATIAMSGNAAFAQRFITFFSLLESGFPVVGVCECLTARANGRD